MRFLGLALSGVVVFFLLVFTKRLNKIYLLSFSCVFILSFILAEIFKNYLQTNLWLFETSIFGSNNNNDIISNAERVGLLFTRSGFGGFLRTLFGQMWYIGLASFLLVYVGLFLIFKENIAKIKELNKNKSCNDYDFSSLFIFLGFIATAIISAIFMMHAGMGFRNRIDPIFYGRYNTIMLIPISLYAISKIVINKQKPYIIFAVSIIVFSLFSVFLDIFINQHLYSLMIMYLNVVNYIVFDSIYNNTILAINGFVLIIISIYVKYKQIMLTSIVIAITCFNIYTGFYFFPREIISNNILEISFNDFKNLKVYDDIIFLKGDDEVLSLIVPRIQMALPNAQLTIVNNLLDVTLNTNNTLIASAQDIYSIIIDQRINIDATEIGYNLLNIHNFTYAE